MSAQTFIDTSILLSKGIPQSVCAFVGVCVILCVCVCECVCVWVGGGAAYVCTDFHCEDNEEARIFFEGKVNSWAPISRFS